MKKYIIANWKMNYPSSGIRLYVKHVGSIKRDIIKKARIILAPPFTGLSEIHSIVTKHKYSVELASQNIYCELHGPFTGEVSAPIVKRSGARYTIIGHSERRHTLHETDDTINKKVRAALFSGITPIVCIGETFDELNRKKTETVLKRQLLSAFSGLTVRGKRVLVAYEPVWAISTSKTHKTIHIKEIGERMQIVRALQQKFVKKLSSAKEVRFLYGGSVHEKNAHDILSFSHIDGVLVGGASLNAHQFLSIVQSI